jgi:hypothetical protein
MWLLLGILGLLAEMTVIIVLGRRATADYEGQPLVAPPPGRAPAVAQPAAPGVPPEPVTF